MPVDVIERCIREGVTIPDAQAQILTAVREHRPTIGAAAIHVRSAEMNEALLADALLMRANHPDIILAEKEDGEQRADLADRHRDINLLDVV